jgi:hypothetical protein
MLLRHATACPFRLARDKTGSSSAARMAIMAMTTSNSIKVNPAAFLGCRPINVLERKDRRPFPLPLGGEGQGEGAVLFRTLIKQTLVTLTF